MPSTAEQQREYRSRLKADGRRKMTVVVKAEVADQLHAVAKQRSVSPGCALEHMLSVADSPAGLIGGKRGAQLAQLRGAFEAMTSDVGVAAGPVLARVLQRTALAEAGVAHRARKAGRRNGGGA